MPKEESVLLAGLDLCHFLALDANVKLLRNYPTQEEDSPMLQLALLKIFQKYPRKFIFKYIARGKKEKKDRGRKRHGLSIEISMRKL